MILSYLVILDTVVLPTLTYGAETWSLTQHQSDKLAVTQRSMERNILNVSRIDRIPNERIRERTRIKDVIETTNEMKGRWAGHVARMANDRWAKLTTEWTPREDKRSRGRPKRRWRDGIEGKVGVTWMSTAQDRRKWRTLWRRSASSGVD